MNTTPAIEFRHVTIAFDDVTVLRDVSFTLAQNEMMLVTGASASGKSVLVRLAMGMLQPDAGQVFVQGREVSAMEDDELLNLRSQLLGMVFQDEALFTALNVYDNTAYRLVEHGWPEDKTEAAVREILTFVGLEKDMQKMVAELSGGMKRRLEFARAFVGWPPIMLFDEPTTGLDPLNARLMRDLILHARDFHQMSALVVTKAMNEIPYLIQHYAARDDAGEIVIREADAERARHTRIMVLDKGEIVLLGDYDEFSHSKLKAVTQLLHPQPSAVNPDFHPADPWDKHNQGQHLL
ncbi:MAG: ATP-binding cassette domain-containing protein [Acidobacteria bacterium]|nr:ATP-binding cassette domain-containing protein [Acidobacteriota bacterium]